MKRAFPCVVLATVLWATVAWGATTGTVATDPFDLGTSAALSAMGGVGVAAPAGLWSLAYNPAGLADVGEREVGATYLSWIENTSMSFGAVALPPGFGAGIVGFDQGSITTSDGFLTGSTERISDFGAIAGYGTALPGRYSMVRLGVAAQYWQKNLASVKASTFAVNLGTRVVLLDERLALGATVQNLGPPFKFETSEEDKQPMAMIVGAGWTMPPGTALPVGLGFYADGVKAIERNAYFAGGCEVKVQQILALRAGVNTSGEKTEPTYGVGISYRGYGIDYSYASVSLLDENVGTHRVSLHAGLGGTRDE